MLHHKSCELQYARKEPRFEFSDVGGRLFSRGFSSRRESAPAQAGFLISKLDLMFCHLHLNPAATKPSLN